MWVRLAILCLPFGTRQNRCSCPAFPHGTSICVWIIWDLLQTAWNDIRVADHATILIGRCPALMCFIRRLYSHQPHREFIHWAGSGDLVISAVVVIVICVVQMMVWDLNSKPFGSSGSLHQKQDLLAGVMQQAMQPMVLVSIPPAHRIAPSTTGGAARNIISGLE